MKPYLFSHRSLTAKLLLLFVLFAIILAVFVGGSMRYAFRDHFENQIQPHLLLYLSYIQNDIGLPPDREKAKRLAQQLDVEILIHDESGNWSSHGRELHMEKIVLKHQHLYEGVEYALTEIDGRDHFLMLKFKGMTLFFGIPLRGKTVTLKSALPILILLAILFVLYRITRRMIVPIATIRAGVQRFGSGDLAHRIDIKRCDELGELADSVNSMATELQKMLESKRQLLLAISHELRSPLTRTKVATELLEDEELRERLHRDLNEIEKLIEELLETERLSSTHHSLNLAPHTLNRLILQVLDNYEQKERFRINFSVEDIDQQLDAPRIKLLIKNLLDNALQHSPETTPIKINLYEEYDHIVLQVADEGDGIDKEHLAHLTEPFYRVDPARQRETGGYGLGLYLCRMITEAHGGTLAIHSETNQGTTITIHLPLEKR